MSARHRIRIRTVALVAAAASLMLATGAEAKPAKKPEKPAVEKPASMKTGFAGFNFPSIPHTWLDKTVEVGGDVVRINAYWRDIAPTRPQNPTDPGDRAYNWAALDELVRGAHVRGLEVMITAFNSPRWAQGPNRPSNAAFEVWAPDVPAFGQFGQAIAARYTGAYDPDGAGPAAPLPEVRYHQAWNEPNLGFYLAPQYTENVVASSPDIYRSLLNSFYDGVHAGNPNAQVLVAGTAPYGDDPGGIRMRPMAFWRDVLCLQASGRQILPAPSCADKAKFDIFSHHPINTEGDPVISAEHPDDASTGDLADVANLLRTAERLGTVASQEAHPMWADEFWIESNPPDIANGVDLMTQARWIEQTLYMLWEQGAEVAVYFELNDFKYDPADPHTGLQSGIFFEDWTPKPAVTAFQFPFVSERRTKKQILAWGIAPARGAVLIEKRKGNKWIKVGKTDKLTEGDVFTQKLRIRGPAELRARRGSQISISWLQAR